MTTIGFLACETTVPDLWGGVGERPAQRRGDAFEHDLMVAALEPALTALGLTLRIIDWEAPIEDFEGIDLILLGTAWNYQDKAEQFLAKLDVFSDKGITVCNPPKVVRWNIAKTYLRELSDRGAATIPTLWLDDVTSADLRTAMDQFGSDRIVIKRQVGAGAMGQEMVTRDTLPNEEWRFGHPAMVQPFLKAIVDEGELSFIFIDGELSHVVRKLPAKDDYRIQSLYGGIESIHAPSADEVDAAHAIINALPFETPLYARIDMLRGEDGSLMVMEAELIEPYLYPEQGPQLGELLAKAIAKKVPAL